MTQRSALSTRIYIAGHRGMVGSAIVRHLLDVSRLQALGWEAAIDLEAGLVAAYKDYLGRFA